MMQKISLNAEKSQPISFKRIVIIALPLVLNSFAQVIMSVVDRLFLVQYDVLQSAATGSASMVAMTVIAPVAAIVAFADNMVAQHYGAKQWDQMARPVWTALGVAALMSVGLLALRPLVGQVFGWFGHEPALVTYEKTYMNFIFIAGIIGLLASGFFSYFAGTGQTGKMMVATLAGNGVNMALNWTLIFGQGPFPELGITGAGWATVAGSGVSLVIILGFYVAAGRSQPLLLTPVWDADVLARLWRFGLPAGVQRVVDMGSFTVLILAFGRISAQVALATGLAMQIKSVVYMPVMALARSGAIIAGQERGAKNFAAINALVRRVLLLTVSYSVGAMVIFWLWPDHLMSFFESKKEPERWQEVLALARPLMIISGFIFIPDAFYNVYAQLLRAMGDSVFIMKTYFIVAPLTLVLPTVVLMQLPYAWVPQALYSTIAVFVGALWGVFGWRYRSGLWKAHKVIA